ncbi:MAG: HEAT repeat domain-containing protein, partial [Microcoleaceae cyanobacterium]
NLRETIVNLLAKVSQQKSDILAYLQNVAESDPDIMVREAAVKAIAENWSGDQSIHDFLRKIADHDPYWLVQQCAVKAIAHYGAKTADTLCWLQDVAVSGSQLNVQEVAIQEIAKGWGNDPNVQIFLQNLAEQTNESNLVNVIVQAIAKNWGDQPAIIPWLEGWLNSDRADVRQTVLQTMFYTATHPPYQLLEHHATADNSTGVRQLALQKLARYHHNDINTLATIKMIAKTDPDARVRVTALVELLRGWKDHPDIFEFFCQRAIYDPYHQNDCFLNNPRFTALEILIEHYPDQPKTSQIVHDRAINDPDEQIRGLAQKKLE